MVSSSNVFYLVILLISINGLVSSNTDLTKCRKCKAGFYAKQICNNEHDTICAPCPSNHFMSLDHNVEKKCNLCSSCSLGSYVTIPCSSTSNTQCKSCDHVTESESFKTSCAGEKVPLSNLNIANDNVILDKADETGSGVEEVVDTFINPNVTVISDDVITRDNETEGSGEVILEIPSVDEIIPSDKTTISVLPVSKDVVDEDLIPVSTPVITKKTTETTTKSIATTRTTPLPSESTTRKTPLPTEKPTTTTEKPTTTTEKPTNATVKLTTTERLITKPTTVKVTIKATTENVLDLGTGIKLEDESSEESEEEEIEVTVVPLATEVKSTASKDEKNETPIRAFAPVSERKTEAMTDDSDKVSIGIVIAVAIIAAIVFFIVGFIASKYCRKRRQEIKMMNKIQKNGHHNGSIPVMLDMNTDSYRQNGIYDEIGKEANGKCSISKLDEIVPQHQDNVYAVPEKKKKSEPEIKYIDETTDDEIDNREDEALLETPAPESTNTMETQPLQQDQEDSVHDIDDSNETSPMLNEIQSEIENNVDIAGENDILVEKL